MKKLMISSIILLPVVVLMILLISSTVVAVKSHIYVESVTAQEETLYLKMEDEDNKPESKMQVNIRPFSASNKKLRYSSANEDIVTVDAEGVIKAVNFGRTFVTARSQEDPSLGATISVIVFDTKVHNIELSSARTYIYEGESLETNVNVIPNEAENKNLTYRSSDIGVVEVTQDGRLHGVKHGTATITVTSDENNEIKDQIEITVRSIVKGITIPEDESEVSISSGRTAKFPEVTLQPSTVNENVVYSSSNTSVATVDNLGNIAFSRAGRVRITALVVDGMGNRASVYRDYVCTDGHYTTLAFAESESEFNFSDYSNGTPLPLSIVGGPEGASQPLTATYSIDGVIRYEDGKFYAVSPSVSEVRITVTAEPWDWDGQESTLLKATKVVKIYQDATDIQVDSTMYIAEQTFDMSSICKPVPANTTASISYRCLQGNATYIGSYVTLTGEGLFIFKAIITNHDGTTVEKDFLISHVNADPEETPLSINQGENKELSLKYDGQPVLYAINFMPEEGYTKVEYKSKNTGCALVDSHGHLSVIRGGKNCQVEITSSGEGKEDVVTTITINITQDVERYELWVRSGFQYLKNDRVSFSGASIMFQLRVFPQAATWDKDLILPEHIELHSSSTQRPLNGIYTFNANFSEAFDGDLIFKFDVENSIIMRVPVHATAGKLDEINLLDAEGKPVDYDKEYNIVNGGELKFNFASTFNPSDFKISKVDDITVEGNDYVEGSAVKVNYSTYGITLKQKKLTSEPTLVGITLGGKTVYLKVRVLQDASNLTINESEIIYQPEYDLYRDGNLSVTPQEHTNNIKFEVNSEIASVSDRGIVKFVGTGAAVITIKAVDHEGNEKAQCQITLTYTQKSAAEKRVNLTEENQAEEQKVLLEWKRGTDADKAAIDLGTFAGYVNRQISTSGDAVEVDPNSLEITAVKGGFATITVTLSNEAREAAKTWTIKVYVDRSLTTKEFSVKDNTRTAKHEFDFTLTLGTIDEMAGKEVKIYNESVTDQGHSTADDKYVYNYRATFEKAGALDFVVAFYYTDEAKAFLGANQDHTSDTAVALTLISTFDRLDKINIYNGEDLLSQGSILETLVNEPITLRVDSVEPSDFSLSAEKISVTGVPNVVRDASGHLEIVVTPDRLSMNGFPLTITIGGQTLQLFVKSHKNATEVKVLTDTAITYTGTYKIVTKLVSEDSTNSLKFDIVENGGIASVDQSGNVTFTGEGVILVKVSAVSYNGDEVASTYVTITNVTKAETDRDVRVSESTSNEELTLDWTNTREGGLLAIVFKPGFVENVTIIAQNNEIVRINGYHIEALKGGSTIVTITAHKGDEVWTKEVKVNVNRHATDITFADLEDNDLRNGVTTATTTFVFYTKVNSADALALEGKRLVADNATFSFEKVEGNIAYYRTEVVVSGTQNELIVRLVNGQSDEYATSLEFTSTLGDVTDFELYHNDELVNEDNNIFSFVNIGQSNKLSFYIDLSSIRPADFDFDNSKVNISFNGGANVRFTEFTRNGSKLEFAFYSIEADTTLVTISIGSKQVSFTLISNPLADAIEVRYNGRVLENGETYETFQNNIDLDVILTREDGVVPKTSTISYKVNGQSEGTFRVGSVNVGLGTIEFSADELTFTLTIIKATDLGNFTITVGHSVSGGSRVLIDSLVFADAFDQDLGLSYEMLGTITITLGFEKSALIGVAPREVILNLFKVTCPEGWDIEYTSDGVVTIKTNTTTIANQQVKLEYDGKTVTYNFTKLDIGNINFVGFDMDKQITGDDESGVKMVNPDIYGNGYQQVKVFAKHSYYYVNGQWRKVDFFRMPYEVLAGSIGQKANKAMLDFITWQMNAYIGKNADTSFGDNGLLTRQTGRNIRYLSQNYTLNADGSVSDASGEKVVDENGCFVGENKITFVDPYTEYDPDGTSYVRIYFGSFTGLTEEDVQNNNFGAFYTFTDPTASQTYCETGRYMRVTADDNVGHFKGYNFNVVEDGFTDEKNEFQNEELVNISSTEAFYNNKCVVLQSNFTEDMLTTSDNNKLDKTFIYGNGYEINLQYKSRNGGGNYVYGRAYNLYIKGGDPEYQNGEHDDRVLEINGTLLVYCDVSAVNKGNIWRQSDDVHIRNTIFKYCKECAIQIYKRDTTVPNKVYIEDVTIVDCLAAIEFVVAELPDNDGSVEGYYIKGFLDVFNYRCRDDLDPFLDDFGGEQEKQMGLIMIDEAIARGKKENVIEEYNNADYFNLLIFNSQTKLNVPGLDSFHRSFHYYDIESQMYKLVDASGKNAKLTYKDGTSQYDFLRMLDTGGLLDSVLGVGIWGYGNRSDIKVTCQYKLNEKGEREFNSDHLKWHMQRVKRDHALIGYDYSTHEIPA